MTYITCNLGITESQRQTLMEGNKIFVERSQFKGNVPVPLTKAQAELIATASRGINLKLSGPARKVLKGEGFVGDVAAAALPIARKGVDYGLDKLQGIVPTHKAGPFKPIADVAVNYARKGVNWGVGKIQDKLKKMLGGAAGVAAIEAKYGQGWFKDYLLPGVETAAKIAVPLIRGGHARNIWEGEIDKKMGSGWFKDYLLPGVESAAKIAVPLIRGSGMNHPVDGEGFFSNLLGVASSVAKSFGGGWTPMSEQKKVRAQGLVL